MHSTGDTDTRKKVPKKKPFYAFVEKKRESGQSRGTDPNLYATSPQRMRRKKKDGKRLGNVSPKTTDRETRTRD